MSTELHRNRWCKGLTIDGSVSLSHLQIMPIVYAARREFSVEYWDPATTPSQVHSLFHHHSFLSLGLEFRLYCNQFIYKNLHTITSVTSTDREELLEFRDDGMWLCISMRICPRHDTRKEPIDLLNGITCMQANPQSVRPSWNGRVSNWTCQKP